MQKTTLLIFSILFFTISCDSNFFDKSNIFGHKASDQKTAKKKSKKRLPIVHSSKVLEQSLSTSVIINGTLEAFRHVNLFNQSDGMLVKLPFHEGDQVKKGQVLARLDDTLIQIDHRKAVLNHQQARLDLSRIQKLVPKNLVAKDEVSRAKTKVALAAAEEKKQQARLAYTIIKAPFDGLISSRLREPGDILPIHSHLMTIIDVSKLMVKLTLSELFLPQIKINDSVSLQIDALGNKKFQGKIIRLYPAIDSASRRGTLEVELSPTPQAAMPGQLCRVSLSSHPKKYTTIPLAAVRHDRSSAYVYRLDEKSTIVSKTAISIGQSIGNVVEIIDGLKRGESVISKGQFGLSDGMKVKVVGATKSQEKAL